MAKEDELSRLMRDFYSGQARERHAKIIQSKIRSFLAQEKLLVRWEKKFYDIMARTIQKKIKQYLSIIRFHEFSRGNRA